jgi:FMN phosphatase YigB (HAD superfamily)
MPLSLEQYAAYLDSRGLHWPAAPEPEPAKARRHLVKMPGVRAVVWNVYGTLLSIAGGDIWFTHPQAFAMQVALDKTVQEFKMWSAMSRRPGQPAEYLAILYEQALLKQKMAGSGSSRERVPEVWSERVWEAVLKLLCQKDYRFDTNFYGALNELSRKVAYFFHSCLQGTACYPGAADAMLRLKSRGLMQGLLADAQHFTPLQLQRGLAVQVPGMQLSDLLDDGLRFLSCEAKARKPSERLFRKVQSAIVELGIAPEQVLHIGSSITRDLLPARRLGFRTALFAGDKASLQATPEQLKDSAGRPDVLLTELSQLEEVIP